MIMSESNPFESAPAVPCHLSKDVSENDTEKERDISQSNMESDILKDNDVVLSNEKEFLELLDANCTENEVQT